MSCKDGLAGHELPRYRSFAVPLNLRDRTVESFLGDNSWDAGFMCAAVDGSRLDSVMGVADIGVSLSRFLETLSTRNRDNET